VSSCAPLNCVGEEGCFGFGYFRLDLIEDVELILFEFAAVVIHLPV